jgi:hypothetical protein
MRTLIFTLITALVIPQLPAYGKPDDTQRSFNQLLRIDSFLSESLELNAEQFQLDEQGARTLKELEEWAEVDPESFNDFFREPEKDEHDPHALYCTEDSSWDEMLLARRRTQQRRGRCVPTRGRILMGCCLMYVRMKLGLPSLGLHARNAGSGLQRHGYCNEIGKHNPNTAPVGAVLVYSGGPSGHIELKTSNGFYFGPTNAQPATTWTSPRRNLIGIYVRCQSK